MKTYINTDIYANFTKILNAVCCSPFYAKEVGLSGGEINSLCFHKLIVETGNTREEFVPVGGGLYKKVIAREWRIDINGAIAKRKEIDKMMETLLLAHEALMNF